jgi:hypothetical protein
MREEWLSSLSISFTAYTIDLRQSSHPFTFQHDYGIHSIVPESSEKFLHAYMGFARPLLGKKKKKH